MIHSWPSFSFSFEGKECCNKFYFPSYGPLKKRQMYIITLAISFSSLYICLASSRVLPLFIFPISPAIVLWHLPYSICLCVYIPHIHLRALKMALDNRVCLTAKSVFLFQAEFSWMNTLPHKDIHTWTCGWPFFGKASLGSPSRMMVSNICKMCQKGFFYS